jgi:hypothetical protein
VIYKRKREKEKKRGHSECWHKWWRCAIKKRDRGKHSVEWEKNRTISLRR